MKKQFLIILIATVAVFHAPLSSAETELTILASGDNRGRINPCISCGEAVPLGGLARRATAIAKHRQEQSHTLTVDAGVFLFGDMLIKDPSRIVGEAYAFMNYDAVNISSYDFRAGKDHTMEVINSTGLKAISANLRDQSTGESLFPPYLIKRKNGMSIGLIGITEPPSGLEFLPHLRRQLAGIEIIPPLQTLAEQLPELQRQTDRIVLLYAGSSRTLSQIIEQFSDQIDLIATAGLLPDQWVLTKKGPPVLIPPVNGQGLGIADFSSRRVPIIKDPLLLGPKYTDNRDLARLIEEMSPPPEKVTFEQRLIGVAAPAGALPDQPVIGQFYHLQGKFNNRGAKVNVRAAGIFKEFGNITAPPEHLLLVARTRWENIIPLTVMEKQAVATEYRIPNLDDHLYLVVNDRKTARLCSDAIELPSHLPTQPLILEHIGSRREGHVIFTIPAHQIESLELRLYDFAHGHAQFTLLQPPEKREFKTPLFPAGINEIVEAGIYHLQITDSMKNHQPSAGMVFAELDLRARSMFTFEADATAFDPHAEPGEITEVGTVADWLEAHKYSHLIVNGEYSYTPDPELTRWNDDPRFLPDLMTGGRMIFAIPENFQSLVFRADFPNARLPSGEVIRPGPIRFALHGEPEQPPEREPFWSVRDDTLKISLTGQSAIDFFAGTRADRNKLFLVLDVTVYNHGDKPEFFQTSEQLRYVDARGRQANPHPATFNGVYRPIDHVWVPDNEQRSFQIAYLIDHDESRPRLAFRGFTMTETIQLSAPKMVTVNEVENDIDEITAETPVPVAEKPEQPPSPAPPEEEIEIAEELVAHEPVAEKESAKKPETITIADDAERVPIHPDLKPRGLAGVGLTAEEVNQAIDRGADFLWKELSGTTGIRGFQHWQEGTGGAREADTYALALLHAGFHERNEEFNGAVRRRLENLDLARFGSSRQTYEMAVLAMLIESYGDPAHLPLLRNVARWLVEAQGPGGIWAYTARDIPRNLYLPEKEEPSRLIVSGGRSLDELESPAERWERLTDWEVGGDKDLSVAQFALLGLHSTERTGTLIPEVTWRRTLEAHLGAQTDDGGWGYTLFRRSGYGSMTCAGICALAISRHALNENDPEIQTAIERGLAWLNRYFTVEDHPPGNVRVAVGGKWLYYYLYSLERVGRILDTEFIGEHEWYPLGARFLVGRQNADGSWTADGERPEELATAFALLFLTRATPTLDAKEEIERGGDGILATSVTLPAPGRVYIMLDASGSLLEEYQGRMTFDYLREAVRKVIQTLPENTEVALRVFGHQYRAIEPEADQDTRLEIPMGPLNRAVFEAKLDELRPRGKTPLALSLQEAARDLSRVRRREDQPVLVLLVADGEENTRPRQDPLAAARELARLEGLDAHVIGFDVDRPEHAEQLRAIAGILDATIQMADQPTQIAARIDAIFRPDPPSFKLFDREDRSIIESARFGESIILPEGKYILRAGQETDPMEASIWINTNRTTSVNYAMTKISVPDYETTELITEEPPSIEQPAPTRFCTQCGQRIGRDTRFCTGCGTPVR